MSECLKHDLLYNKQGYTTLGLFYNSGVYDVIVCEVCGNISNNKHNYYSTINKAKYAYSLFLNALKLRDN